MFKCFEEGRACSIYSPSVTVSSAQGAAVGTAVLQGVSSSISQLQVSTALSVSPRVTCISAFIAEAAGCHQASIRGQAGLTLETAPTQLVFQFDPPLGLRSYAVLGELTQLEVLVTLPSVPDCKSVVAGSAILQLVNCATSQPVTFLSSELLLRGGQLCILFRNLGANSALGSVVQPSNGLLEVPPVLVDFPASSASGNLTLDVSYTL